MKKAQRRRGTLAQGHKGAQRQIRRGTKALRHNGTDVPRRRGTAKHRYKVAEKVEEQK